jgi:hypothetical protein
MKTRKNIWLEGVRAKRREGRWLGPDGVLDSAVGRRRDGSEGGESPG